VILAAVLASGGGSSKSRTTTTLAATTGSVAFPNVKEKALLELVPSNIRGSCKRQEASLDIGAEAGVQCTPLRLANAVTYQRFPTSRDLDIAYDRVRSALSIQKDTAKDCMDVTNNEGSYQATSGSGGRVVCYQSAQISHLVWTVADKHLLARAERSDVYDHRLYLWWVGIVDRKFADFPNADEQALLSHVPSDMRATCVRSSLIDGGIAAVDCLPADADAVYFNLMRDKNAMGAVYEANLKTMAVTREMGQPPACPFERSYNTKNVPNGRVSCGPDDNRKSLSLQWTDDALVIISFVIRDDGNAKELSQWFQQFGFS
jgi:hypothetical protein